MTRRSTGLDYFSNAGSATLYRRMSAAYWAGHASAVAGQRFCNPYSGTADTALERVLSVMWCRGYERGNPMPEPVLE